MKKVLIVTGGAGFIGSAFVREALDRDYRIIVLDKLTYAGILSNLEGLDLDFIKGDIQNFELVSQLLKRNLPVGLVNFAAESHVDNSISGPRLFVETNVLGTFSLLEAVRASLPSLPKNFRFLHVSTDEVYGDLDLDDPAFDETTSYDPHSPYSATKAASDHLVRAWAHTYGLPVILTNCSNNYGPRQYPEKLIPRLLDLALAGKKLPIYGSGENIRDWIYVQDHVKGILLALEKGRLGQSYCFGGESERTNIGVVRSLCRFLDEKRPIENNYEDQIELVSDRLGHDRRYAINGTKAKVELGYENSIGTFEQGLSTTIDWYLENTKWLAEAKERQK